MNRLLQWAICGTLWANQNLRNRLMAKKPEALGGEAYRSAAQGADLHDGEAPRDEVRGGRDDRRAPQGRLAIGLDSFSEWMDFGFAALIGLASLYLFIAAPLYIDKVVLEPEEIPPIFFPRVVLGAVFLLTLGVMLRLLLGRSNIRVDLTWRGVQRVAVLFVSMLLYILVFKRLGFILTTGLLIFFQSWYYGNRSWIKLVLVTVIFPPVVYILFRQIFHIYLPRGIF